MPKSPKPNARGTGSYAWGGIFNTHFWGDPTRDISFKVDRTYGTLSVEEINNDRQSFAQKLTSEAASDLERMGIGVDVLTIQEISDEEGYLDALGKRRTAEVKRDAQIGEAEATRDHTEKMLTYLGADITVTPEGEGRAITIKGQPVLQGRPIRVPGDPSSAAFLAAAALIVPGSEIVIEAAHRYRRKVLVASTSEIYGKNSGGPLSETSTKRKGATAAQRPSASWTAARSCVALRPCMPPS